MERKRIVRKPVEEEEEDVVETQEDEVTEEDVDTEEVEDDDAQDDVQDDDEIPEFEEPAPKARKPVAVPAPASKKVVAAPKVAAKPVAKAVAAPVAKPAAKPAVKAAAPVVTKKVVVPPPPVKKAVAKAVAPAEEPEETEAAPAPKTIAVKTVNKQIVDDVLTAFLDALNDGQSLLMTPHDGKWIVSIADATKVAKAVAKGAGKLSGQAYWKEVCTPEYLESEAMWLKLTEAEKRAHAKKAGAKWEPSNDPKVEIIRMTSAYREALGIKKYKPEYESRKAREALRG